MNDQQIEALLGLIAVHIEPLQRQLAKQEAQAAVTEMLVQTLLGNFLVDQLQMDAGALDEVFQALRLRVDAENASDDPNPELQRFLGERRRLMQERLQHMRAMVV